MGSRRKINDCFYYYNGYCYKGDNCPFRHEPRALMATDTCKKWRRRRCYNPHCSRRHAEHNRGPRYWEERVGRTPFLISRYMQSQSSVDNRERWIRKVYLTFDSNANVQANSNAYSPISGHRDWTFETNEQPLEREDMRIVLKRMGDPQTSEMSCLSSDVEMMDEDCDESPLKIKTERTSAQKGRGGVCKSENDVGQQYELKYDDSRVSTASGCNLDTRHETTMVFPKTEQHSPPGLSEGTAIEINSPDGREKLSNFNNNPRKDFHGGISDQNFTLLNKCRGYEEQAKCNIEITCETKCKNYSSVSNVIPQLCLNSPRIPIIRLQRSAFSTEEIGSCMKRRRRAKTWRVTNMSATENQQMRETADKPVRPSTALMKQFSSLNDSTFCSRSHRTSSGISATCAATPSPIGYYTRSRARAERTLGRILKIQGKE